MNMINDAQHVAQHEAARESAGRAALAGGEFLTFRLGEEEYGIDILRVQEIRSYEPPTRIANAPSFIKGVVNLRGVIVPIVDLRLKLGCDSAELNGGIPGALSNQPPIDGQVQDPLLANAGLADSAVTDAGNTREQATRNYELDRTISYTNYDPVSVRRLSVAVMLDEPSNGRYYGGDVAAPVFSEVVQQTLRMMRVQPDIAVKPMVVTQLLEKESF